MTNARVDRPEAALTHLAEAEARADERLATLTARINALAEAQQRTETQLQALTVRVDQLAARMDGLAERMDQFAAAQVQTTERLDSVAMRLIWQCHIRSAWRNGRKASLVGTLPEAGRRPSCTTRQPGRGNCDIAKLGA